MSQEPTKCTRYKIQAQRDGRLRLDMQGLASSQPVNRAQSQLGLHWTLKVGKHLTPL